MSDWTNEPPTEPGYYWMRWPGSGEAMVACWTEDNGWVALNAIEGFAFFPNGGNVEFWPQRIEPPPDGERALREIAEMVQARCDELNGEPPGG